MESALDRQFGDTMLLLGRLDGRLQHNPCADIFLARSRIEGAVALAGLAGVPIAACDLQDWIAGRRPPPRASEGLNDPISVAAVFHFAISRDEDASDPVLRSTLNVLRSVLDDRREANAYGREDLAYFGPMWRIVREAANAPLARADLMGVSERLLAISALTDAGTDTDFEATMVDGRTWDLPPRSRDRNWLLAVTVPRLLHRARLTTRIIPSLVLLPKLLPRSPGALAEAMLVNLRRSVEAGLRDLDEIERASAKLIAEESVTRRSKAPLLSRLQLTYPGLTPKAVARLLNVSPQGARKLLSGRSSRAAAVKAPRTHE